MAKEIILGIDLGTTNSVVSYLQSDGTVKVVANPEGTMTTPSVVGFKPDGETIVGNAAKRQVITNPDTVLSVKRKMGSAEKIHIKCINKLFTPQEISSKVLGYIKSYAEASIGQPIEKAVITCPAYFNDAQRQATKDAGTIAGLDVVRIINEPTAAALAYGLGQDKNEKIAVFDLGGGTLDVSILEIEEGTFEVIATSGDNKLGGDDWDEVLAKWIREEVKKEFNQDFGDKIALQRYKDVAEKAKIELSSQAETTISLPFIGMGPQGPISFETTITRAKFEEMTKHLLNRCVEPLKKAIEDAKLTYNDIDQVLLIGGSIRMPAVQNLVTKITGKQPNLSVNPDEAVSIGAAYQGGILSGEVNDIILLDVTPLTLGIETEGGVMTSLIPRNTTIPTTKSRIFSTAHDKQEVVDIMVYQGERPMAHDNKLIGNFQLTGITPAPRGTPRIEVIFSIDVNGIVKVTAKDLDTQKEQAITISGSNGLSKEEIDRMLREAELNREADDKRKEEIKLKHRAETYLNEINDVLRTDSRKFSEEEKAQVEKLRDVIQTALYNSDYNTLSAKIEKLEASEDFVLEDLEEEVIVEVKEETKTSVETSTPEPAMTDATTATSAATTTTTETVEVKEAAVPAPKAKAVATEAKVAKTTGTKKATTTKASGTKSTGAKKVSATRATKSSTTKVEGATTAEAKTTTKKASTSSTKSTTGSKVSKSVASSKATSASSRKSTPIYDEHGNVIDAIDADFTDKGVDYHIKLIKK